MSTCLNKYDMLNYIDSDSDSDIIFDITHGNL